MEAWLVALFPLSPTPKGRFFFGLLCRPPPNKNQRIPLSPTPKNQKTSEKRNWRPTAPIFFPRFACCCPRPRRSGRPQAQHHVPVGAGLETGEAQHAVLVVLAQRREENPRFWRKGGLRRMPQKGLPKRHMCVCVQIYIYIYICLRAPCSELSKENYAKTQSFGHACFS